MKKEMQRQGDVSVREQETLYGRNKMICWQVISEEKINLHFCLIMIYQ